MERESWTVAEAKAKFSEVIERARTDGPQRITKNGRDAAVVVASEEWQRKVARKGTLADFLAESPLRESGLEIEPRKKAPRELDL
jgi:prevent-host-death family protein